PARTPVVPAPARAPRDSGRAGARARPYVSSARPRPAASRPTPRRAARGRAGRRAHLARANGDDCGETETSCRLPPKGPQPRAARAGVAGDFIVCRRDDASGQLQPGPAVGLLGRLRRATPAREAPGAP